MDAVVRLQELYDLRERLAAQIEKVEALLGVDPQVPKERKKRGPNKPKDTDQNVE